MSTVRDFLTMSSAALQDAGIATARLDSELLLSAYLGLPREWLLAHDDAEIAEPQWNRLCQLLYQRAQRYPLAYLIGIKEFYGRDFVVDERVLIPRPESEQIIEALNQLISQHTDIHRLIDVGTGSGCLAITAQLEHPDLDVHACDNSPAALTVARRNAERLITPPAKEVHFYLSNWLDQIPDDLTFDVVIANLPYVDPVWPDLSPELAYEPSSALYDEGPEALGSIKRLLTQLSHDDRLRPDGYVILEMDRRQIKAATTMAQALSFTVTKQQPFTLILQKTGSGKSN